MDRAKLEDEARYVYERYTREFVEGLGMCPWAARARAEGHVVERYLLDPEADESAALDVIAAFGADPDVEVGLVIFPQVMLDRADFERFVARLRELDVARHRPSRAPLALAAFHPDAEANTETPYRLVPFIRRTPDPTIQCVRVDVLDALRKEERGTNYVDPKGKDLATLMKLLKDRRPPLHERVAEMNRETLLAHGLDAARRLLDDILADRDLRYERLGVPPRSRP